jgi:hypothetical protein
MRPSPFDALPGAGVPKNEPHEVCRRYSVKSWAGAGVGGQRARQQSRKNDPLVGNFSGRLRIAE